MSWPPPLAVKPAATTAGPAHSPARHSSACTTGSTPRPQPSCPPPPASPATATASCPPAVQAQAYAGLGDQQACNRALDTANRVLDLADTASPGGWLRFDGSRLAEERGTCYLTTGQHAQAEAALTEALSRTVSLRRRGSLLADLAVLGAQRRDIDQVLHYAAGAVDLAEQTGSTGYVGRKLCHLQAEVRPLLADARVAELNERITRLPVTS